MPIDDRLIFSDPQRAGPKKKPQQSVSVVTHQIVGAGADGKDPWAPSVPWAEVKDYIHRGALRRGLNPEVPEEIAWLESAGHTSWHGDRKIGGSWGPMQLYMGGGMGNTFEKNTGKSPSDLSTWKEQIDFSLDTMAQSGSTKPWSVTHNRKHLQNPMLGGDSSKSSSSSSGAASSSSSGTSPISGEPISPKNPWSALAVRSTKPEAEEKDDWSWGVRSWEDLARRDSQLVGVGADLPPNRIPSLGYDTALSSSSIRSTPMSMPQFALPGLGMTLPAGITFSSPMLAPEERGGRAYSKTVEEQIEEQDRANARNEGITYEEYKIRRDAQIARYLANKKAIDKRIRDEDRELDAGDEEDDGDEDDEVGRGADNPLERDLSQYKSDFESWLEEQGRLMGPGASPWDRVTGAANVLFSPGSAAYRGAKEVVGQALGARDQALPQGPSERLARAEKDPFISEPIAIGASFLAPGGGLR